MTVGKAENADRLTSPKDDNAALNYFDRLTMLIFKCIDA